MIDNIDFVFPYVNCDDDNWKNIYKKTLNTEFIPNNRFRDWNLVKYIILGIHKFMPYIRNIYIIVSSETQIPNYIDISKIHIIYHKDIIPKELLPTFNSCTIEMFLSNINGLSEHFIYGNDDTIPINYISKTDLFDEEDKPCLHFNFFNNILNNNIFRKQCYSGKELIEDMLGLEHSVRCLKPDHIFLPMLKSTCEKVLKYNYDKILKNSSKLRESNNYNQYIYHYYQYFTKQYNDKQLNFIYVKTTQNIEIISNIIKNQEYKAICINDIKGEIDFENIKNKLNESFTYIFKENIENKNNYNSIINNLNLEILNLKIKQKDYEKQINILQSKNIELENENIKLMKEKSEISRRKFNELYKKR